MVRDLLERRHGAGQGGPAGRGGLPGQDARPRRVRQLPPVPGCCRCHRRWRGAVQRAAITWRDAAHRRGPMPAVDAVPRHCPEVPPARRRRCRGSAHAFCARCPAARWAWVWAARPMYEAGLPPECRADTPGCPGPGRRWSLDARPIICGWAQAGEQPRSPDRGGGLRGWPPVPGVRAVTRPAGRKVTAAFPGRPRRVADDHLFEHRAGAAWSSGRPDAARFSPPSYAPGENRRAAAR